MTDDWLSRFRRTAWKGLLGAVVVTGAMVYGRRWTTALTASEQHWKAVFDQSPTMGFLVDAAGTILSLNALAGAQLGYAEKDLVGRPWLELSFDADRALDDSQLARCVEAPGSSQSWEARKVRGDGTVLWTRENARFVQWDGKDPVFLVFCEDITQARKARTEAQEAVSRGQAYLLEAQRLGHIGSWSLDAATDVWSTSPELLRIFGLDPGDKMTVDLIRQRVHPDDRAFIEGVIESRRSSPDDYEYDFRIILPDGETRHLHSVSRPVLSEDGALLEYVGTTMDVTERKQAEDLLRRSEASLHEAQRIGRMGSWSQDAASGAMSATPELYRIFGLDPGKDRLTRQVLGQSIHPDDRANVVAAIERGRSANAVIEVDHRIVLPDGTIRYVHGASHPIFADGGAVVEWIGTVMDVTELRQAEEALRQAYADLARASRVSIIGELTAALAHEVNQPIAAAVANANAALRFLAGDSPNLEEARAAVEAIASNGARAADIISRTRRLFEKGAPQRELTAVDDVVRETVLLLGGEALRHAVAIRTSATEDAPPIVADRVQLQQVLMNLILNGIEAVKEVDGRREIAIRSQIADGVEIMVSVSDTGVGLPSEHADRLFDTFFTTKAHGTGMGLSISRSIIAGHGGRLWAEPNEPHGAVFRFTLPLASAPAPTG
jgi:PAS domain S-box-containing protein